MRFSAIVSAFLLACAGDAQEPAEVAPVDTLAPARLSQGAAVQVTGEVRAVSGTNDATGAPINKAFEIEDWSFDVDPVTTIGSATTADGGRLVASDIVVGMFLSVVAVRRPDGSLVAVEIRVPHR